MDQQSEKYKVRFKEFNGSEGFKYFFNDNELLKFLRTPPGQIITLEQYDRKTNSFQSFEQ